MNELGRTSMESVPPEAVTPSTRAGGQDALQIGLEHHRGGRILLAEAEYHKVLALDPDNFEALHWLGVLTFQAGRPDAAIPLLEQCASARPGDPAFANNLAQAYLHAGRNDDAIKTFERGLALDPNSAQSLFGLAIAHFTLKPQPDPHAAIKYFKQAHLAGMDSAELHFHSGIAQLTAGQVDAAIESFRTAAQKNHGSPEPLLHLAIAHKKKGDTVAARHWVAAALQIDPTSARAWQLLGVLEAEAGRLEEAETLFRGAITAKGNFAAAFEGLAVVLKQQGKPHEAIAALQEAERLNNSREARVFESTPADAIAALDKRLVLNELGEAGQFALAVKSNVAPPPQIPAESVVTLFDKYAERFDEHLRGTLGYRVPELIAETVAKLDRQGPLDILDLGCGTGLCGMLLKPIAASVHGVDLSPIMLAKSKARGVYESLILGDVIKVMEAMQATFDLIVAADVVIYIGDLTPVFVALLPRLRAGGRFAVSIEAAPGDRYRMNVKGLRFAHSLPYLRHIAGIFGLIEEICLPTTLRTEATVPVPGHLLIFRLPA